MTYVLTVTMAHSVDWRSTTTQWHSPKSILARILVFFFIRHRVPFSAIESPEAKDIFTPLLGKPPTDLTFRDICHETEKSLKDKVRVENTCLDPS